MTITKDIIYVGVNDHQVDLFEGQYDVPNGMAYNSYCILDEKVAIMDTEEHLQGARRAYNSNVSELNRKVVSFPTSIVAGMSGIRSKEFFEAEAAKREDVNVNITI